MTGKSQIGEWIRKGKSQTGAEERLTRSPLIRMFEWESKTIVNSSNLDQGLSFGSPWLDDTSIDICSSGVDLVDSHQPVVIVPVSVSDDVVKDDKSFELRLELSLVLFRQGIIL